MKVSIIMPVYNSAEYVRKAVESVVNQDFDDFELIMVDDGSTDGSAEVCDKLAEEYNKIKVIHKENGGICSARNAALEIAAGEYIGFCDNDDEYLPGLIRENYEMAKTHDVDLMRYARKRILVRDDGKTSVSIAKIPEEKYVSKELFGENYAQARILDAVWSAFFRKEIIDKYCIRFDETFKYGAEDRNFSLKYLIHSEILGFNPKCYYVWTQRDSRSTSRKFRAPYLDNELTNLELERVFFEETCDKKVDNYVKNKFLANGYVYWLIEYLNIKSCDISIRDKVEFLKKIRSNSIFDEKISKQTLRQAKSESLRLYIVMKLFYKGHYRLLLRMLKTGSAMLDLFRFKRSS